MSEDQNTTKFVSLRALAANATSRVELTQEIIVTLRKSVQQDVQQFVDAKYIGRYRDPEAMEVIGRQVRKTIERMQPELTEMDKKNLTEIYTNEVSGYGVLEALLIDSSVTEIIVQRYDSICIERFGRMEESNLKFDDEEALKLVVEKILLPTGRTLSWTNCAIDARLSDGSRVNVVGPPIAPEGIQIVIRKFRKSVSIDTLVEWGAMNTGIRNYLVACVEARMNLFISGGTGSGKTTMVNALAEHIPHDQQIITIENPIEFTFRHPMVRRWEARPATLEGKGEITQRFLVYNGLRARPDRMIVGEVRGVEAYDMLRAMQTGHPGSLTTGHADSEDEAMTQLIGMTASADVIGSSLVPNFVAKGLDIVVQVSRLKDKSRKVTGISEVIKAEGNQIILNQTHKFEIRGYAEGKVVGDWIMVNSSVLADKFSEQGINLKDHWIK